MNFFDLTLKIIFTPGLVVGATFAALLLIIGHWFPWQQWLGQPIGRLAAYTYGTACLLVGYTLWRAFFEADLATPLGLALICAVGGLTVGGLYRFDAYILARARRRRHNLANNDGEKTR